MDNNAGQRRAKSTNLVARLETEFCEVAGQRGRSDVAHDLQFVNFCIGPHYIVPRGRRESKSELKLRNSELGTRLRHARMVGCTVCTTWLSDR